MKGAGGRMMSEDQNWLSKEKFSGQRLLCVFKKNKYIVQSWCGKFIHNGLNMHKICAKFVSKVFRDRRKDALVKSER